MRTTLAPVGMVGAIVVSILVATSAQAAPIRDVEIEAFSWWVYGTVYSPPGARTCKVNVRAVIGILGTEDPLGYSGNNRIDACLEGNRGWTHGTFGIRVFGHLRPGGRYLAGVVAITAMRNGTTSRHIASKLFRYSLEDSVF